MSTDVVELISEAWRQLRAADLEGARSTFRAALEIDDHNFEAWIGLGRCDRGSGDLDAAVDDFTRAASIQPTAARPFLERGAIEKLRGNYSDSLRDYKHARQVDPAYPTLDSY
ncbi:tetratricopeptide repeat protein, partial [Clavibacter michiganensis]|uniref:tetratricopeptide repeat protein n=1 Tax=Clavibacter michiganensis TaxID=28447 RepID=UPI002931E47F